MNANQGTFHYSYSAGQQEEVKRIREKYIPKEENRLERLRKLDAQAEKPGTIAGITLGSIGALILGLGMCCTMVWGGALFAPGILLGIVGFIIAVAAYPRYKKITERQRKKAAAEILKLTEEMAQE